MRPRRGSRTPPACRRDSSAATRRCRPSGTPTRCRDRAGGARSGSRCRRRRAACCRRCAPIVPPAVPSGRCRSGSVDTAGRGAADAAARVRVVAVLRPPGRGRSRRPSLRSAASSLCHRRRSRTRRRRTSRCRDAARRVDRRSPSAASSRRESDPPGQFAHVFHISWSLQPGDRRPRVATVVAAEEALRRSARVPDAGLVGMTGRSARTRSGRCARARHPRRRRAAASPRSTSRRDRSTGRPSARGVRSGTP